MKSIFQLIKQNRCFSEKNMSIANFVKHNFLTVDDSFSLQKRVRFFLKNPCVRKDQLKRPTLRVGCRNWIVDSAEIQSALESFL